MNKIKFGEVSGCCVFRPANQISANRGTDSSLVLKANINVL